MDLAKILPAVEIGVPLYLVISYVVIISICILFIRLRLGLAVSFLLFFILDIFTIEIYYLKLLKALP